MPNIKAVLQAEIARIAKKQTGSEIKALRQTIVQQRSQLAAVKREVQALQRQIKQIAKGAGTNKKAAAPLETSDESGKNRFSAKGFATLRQRLGISAAAMGQLLGVSPLSVYKWEGGKAKPRAKHLPGIASLRGIGKREAAARLEALA